MYRFKLTTSLALASVLVLGTVGLAGCSNTSNDASKADKTENKTVTLVTHDSFSKDILKSFEKDTGYKLKLVAKDSAGSMLNQLVLTANNPLGDVAFGVDNTLSGLALDKKVFVPSGVKDLPVKVKSLSPDPETLVPMDQGDVCLNVDLKWFEDKKLKPPTSLDDLIKSEYKGLFVTENPAKSSPGLAFMLATVAKYGENGWLDYWQKLKANGVKVSGGWTEAYNQDFTLGEAKTGKYPIVTSYSSSPSYTVDKETKKPKSASVPATCYRQVEYAGVLKGAKNPEGAKVFIEWMLSKKIQEQIPETMYVYPVLPEAMDAAYKLGWDKLTETPLKVDPSVIEKHRKKWLDEFTQKIIG